MRLPAWLRGSATKPGQPSTIGIARDAQPVVTDDVTVRAEELSPCGFVHFLQDAMLNERVGGESMPRYALVKDPVSGTIEPHLPEDEAWLELSAADGEVARLRPGTRLRYDQLDYSLVANVGWHRFQVLSGKHAGQCIRIDGPFMGDGDYAYIPDMPSELEPAKVEPGAWETERPDRWLMPQE